jgi:hypothetical protein
MFCLSMSDHKVKRDAGVFHKRMDRIGSHPHPVLRCVLSPPAAAVQGRRSPQRPQWMVGSPGACELPRRRAAQLPAGAWRSPPPHELRGGEQLLPRARARCGGGGEVGSC